MADVTVSVTNVTPEESRAAQWALDKTNEERAAQVPPLPAYPSVNEMLADGIENTQLPSWLDGEARESGGEVDIDALWTNATDSQRDAAVVALGG